MRADRNERLTAGIFLAALTVIFAVTWPVRLTMIGNIPQFFVMYLTLLVATDVAAMVLLGWRAYVTGDRRTALVASGYAFSIPIVFGNVLTVPGVMGGFPFPLQAPPFLWSTWHIGWGIVLVFYAFGIAGTIGVRSRIVVALSAGSAVVFAAVVFGNALPTFLAGDGSFRPILSIAIAAAVALYAIAIVGFARRYRTLTPLELWIACAAVAISFEALLTLFSPVRFEVGTYVARAFSVFSSCVVFASLGVDALRADRRAWLSRRQASLAEASPQIVLLVARGAVSYVNRPFTETTGLSADAAIGVQWLRALADDRTIEDRRFAHALLAGEAFDGYARIPTLQGPRTFLVRSAPMRESDDASARETGTWLVTAVDVEEQRRAMEELRALYARERRISTALQNVAVPAVLPQIDGVAFDAVYRAATREGEVGGDWYDVFTVDEGTVAFSIGDTTGHGLEAASAMVRVRETIRAAASSLGAQPREVLAFVNRALCTANDDLLATAIFGVYEPQTRRVSYAVAGHPAPLLREGSGVVVLPGGGLTLGVDADAAYTTETFVLDDDAALALYTDGLTENERDLIAGETRLAELFADRGRSARAIVDAVTAAGQYDDVALLVIAAVPFARSVPVWRFHSDDPETARTARASFAEYLTRRGYSPDAVGVAELVFGELVGNVVRHAPGPIDIDLAWSDGTPVLRVHDRGAAIVRRAIDLPADIMSESGRGLFLVRTLAGEPVFAQRPGGGNVVTVRLTEILTALAS